MYPDGIPAAVRDGIAMCVGALVTSGPSSTSAVKSETIGDYSYTLGATVYMNLVAAMSPVGWALLRPYVLRPVTPT